MHLENQCIRSHLLRMWKIQLQSASRWQAYTASSLIHQKPAICYNLFVSASCWVSNILNLPGYLICVLLLNGAICISF
jgi:hypothetical protein